ncbi:MAG TPA: hypothetical protein VMM37_10780 [Bacteroidota bacterium]|nr:hypothetical protein [Bacteroidota bacterium]
MTDIAQLDEIFEKAKEIESYVGQSQIILKSLITAKEDAGVIIRSLSQKQEDLTRLQQDISGYLKTLQTVSQKAEAILTPMDDQKKELAALARKVEEGIAGIDDTIRQRLGEHLEEDEAKHKDITVALDTAVSTVRKDVDAEITGAIKKEDDLLKSISQRIEKDEKVVETQRTVLETQKTVLEQEKKEAADLRKSIQELKGMLDKFRGDLKEEINGALTKQKEELTSGLDKRYQELNASIKDLSDKHIKVLEKDNSQIKSTLNSIISKLGNVKFKKILGL